MQLAQTHSGLTKFRTGPTLLIIAAILLAPLLIYFDTARSIVSVWNSSETFTHGYIIFPISLWLIWKRRNVFAQARPVPFWPALAILAACGFGWLLAELGDVQVVKQYTLVAMIPVAALTLLGLRLSWALAFPLLFLLLAVPFGEIFIDPLINFTADFTVAALQLTGIPVLRDGPNFMIPSGSWSVVEACSGVRYLIASFTLGCLFAYLTYRSRVRQGIFIFLSIAVPIIANGFRAYMIVMIGHLSGMEYAVGVDHLIYGWLFFGVVMFLMYWIGSFWREDDEPTPAEAKQSFSDTPSRPASQTRLVAAAACVLACLVAWPLLAGYMERAGFNPKAVDLAGFQTPWNETERFAEWKPRFYEPSAQFSRFFERDARKVGMSVLYYRNQEQKSGLISSENRLVHEKDAMWRGAGTLINRETISGRQIAVRESHLRGPSGSLLVWHWYWIDERFVTNDYLGKLLQAKEKFLMNGDDGAAIFVYAPYSDNPNEARSVLRGFVNDNLATLEKTLAANKEQ